MFYVECSYENSIEDIYNNNLDKSKLKINIQMAIPIEKNSSDEKYISKIRNMLKRDYEQNNRSVSLTINFYDDDQANVDSVNDLNDKTIKAFKV